MIANKTNSMMIAAACGDTDYTNWSGKQIRLYADLVSFKGAVVEAVRVKRVPKPLAEDLNDEIPL
jgi:hypothetical protein